jgi:hypothetical protein
VAASPNRVLTARVTGSTGLLVAAVTVVGTAVSGWIYRRVAKPGSRPIDA